MNIFYLLIGVSLIGALIFLGMFIWAVKDGQFEDNETPPVRILFDDEQDDESEFQSESEPNSEPESKPETNKSNKTEN